MRYKIQFIDSEKKSTVEELKEFVSIDEAYVKGEY